MTYIVGINHFGLSSIICETKVTWTQSSAMQPPVDDNVILKSGKFFPGCIYAISGSLGHANKFIIECKEYLKSNTGPVGYWQDFCRFIEHYHFPKTENGFYLLLSSRCLGKPTFFTLNSSQGELVQENRFITLGSGKELLDEELQRFFNSIEKSTKESLLNPITYPYIYCLLLNEKIQGAELSKLEQHGVGGLFHFIWQDSSCEDTQLPALYVLSASSPNEKKTCCWIYRVAYVEDVLVVDNPIRQVRQVFASSSANPLRDSVVSPRLQEVREDILSKLSSQAFYYFCGFGFAYPNFKGERKYHISNGDNFVVKQDGWIAPEYKAWLLSLIPPDNEMHLENGEKIQ